jgi:hypothetical protein
MPPPPKKAPPPQFAPWAGFLSYLVPGLGQIVQGRVGKGLLFMVCLYGLFFYGMYLGSWSNVYLPDVTAVEPNPVKLPWPVERLSGPVYNLYNRLQFAGQFWIGVAAWPAIYQYATFDPARADDRAAWGGWATFERAPYENRAREGSYPGPAEAPYEWRGQTLNELQTEGDKTWDLAWVFTVIAGVLNVLVIYDACAGPAFGEAEAKREPQPQEGAA